MPTLSSPAHSHPNTAAAPWIAIAGVASALALVAWAGNEQEISAAGGSGLECRISHPAAGGSATTVMLVNTGPAALPAGTAWAWAPAGGDPRIGEQHVLTQPLARGGAVRIRSSVPAVALRCRAGLLTATPNAASLQQPPVEPLQELRASAGALSLR